MAFTITPGSVSTGTDTSAETAAPSGVTSGDLLVLFVLCDGAVTITTPTGWTQRQNAADAFSACRGGMYERIATGGGDDTPTVTVGAGIGNWQTVIIRVQGQKVTSAYDTSANSTTTSGTSKTLPSVTTAENAELIIAACFTNAGDVTAHPSGYTIQVESEPAASTLVVWTKDAGAAGSYGGESFTTESSGHVGLIAAYKVEVVNTVPVITSNGGGATAEVQVFEAQTAVTTVAANGTPTPTFSKSGTDTGDFAIDTNTGVLTFSPAPTYLSPADGDTNSIYLVTVTATNSEGSDSQDLTVVVKPKRYGATPPAPLDDVEYFYRFLTDHMAGNTQYPNFGTRDEPLVLGSSYAADGQDADWVSDGTLGNHLLYTNAGESFSFASAPQSVIDAASFTAGVRIRWNTLNTIGVLFNVIKDIDTDAKTIFLHKQSNNTYEGRIWDGTTDGQVDVLSTTTGSTSRTDSVVLTYDGTTKTLRIYINGTEENSDVSTNARRLRGSDYYLEWPVGVGLAHQTLAPDCKYFKMFFADRKFSDSEVLALESNTFWTSDATSVSSGSFKSKIAGGLIVEDLAIGGLIQ